MLTTIKLTLKTKHFTKSPHIQYDLEKLKDPKIVEVFQANVGRKFEVLCILNSDADTLANSLKEGLLSKAKEVLGRQRKKIQSWVTNKVLNLRDQKWQLKQQKYTSTEGLEKRKVNREVWKKMKAAKGEWIMEQCKNTENRMMSGNSKEAYNTL